MSVQPEHRRVRVLDAEMAYVEVGSGDPIVFLHGNPTSSYLWRNVIPHLSARGRCIAPDLIGMGDSGKLPGSWSGSYRFIEHRQFLDAFLEAIGVRERVTLVLHDWGSALGFDWARRHAGAVRGIAYMEAIVAPLTWAEWPADAVSLFQALRSPQGESLVLEDNVFVEQILPASILRKLAGDDMDAYRRPFLRPGEERRAMLTWPRELPIDGEPKDVVAVVADYAEFLSASPIPKLFVNAEPGAILVGRAREACRRWPNQTEVTVAGRHFVQEDSPDAIGRAIRDWYRQIPS